MMQPENLDSAVDEFINLLNLDPDKVLQISKHERGYFDFFAVHRSLVPICSINIARDFDF